MICSCFNETPCRIRNGGDSTNHGVLIDDCGVGGDSISGGVGGLVDDRGLRVHSIRAASLMIVLTA